MLVLGRKSGDVIFIGEDIVIRVVEIDRNQVRLGIEAPRGVAIDRPEVRAQKLAKLEAAKKLLGVSA